MFNLFRKPVIKIQIVKRDPFRLTPEEWRMDAGLCQMAAKTLSIPEVRMMLDTLRNAAHGWKMEPTMPDEERAARASANDGYMLCLREFELLAEPIVKPQAMPMPDFAPENRFDEVEEG